jgi:hypothetical protein
VKIALPFSLKPQILVPYEKRKIVKNKSHGLRTQLSGRVPALYVQGRRFDSQKYPFFPKKLSVTCMRMKTTTHNFIYLLLIRYITIIMKTAICQARQMPYSPPPTHTGNLHFITP